MPTISALINARTGSTRLPRKLVLPFAGTTLIDIALEKLNRMNFFRNRYFAVGEDELIAKAKGYDNITLIVRDKEAIKPGYNDHRKVFAHYATIDSDYIMWINPCHPLLSVETVEAAAKSAMDNPKNSFTSVIQTTDWIFNNDGIPVTNTIATMLSSGHSKVFYKVAHGFHIINKAFFLKNYQYWTLTKDDPALIEIPENESYDVNTEMEFNVAEAAYMKNIGR
jgi:CMP-N-acetylneuraminic acid synthetase